MKACGVSWLWSRDGNLNALVRQKEQKFDKLGLISDSQIDIIWLAKESFIAIAFTVQAPGQDHAGFPLGYVW